ncbi:MAG: Flp pilus assembly protein CpaB [Methylovirgula sp.]
MKPIRLLILGTALAAGIGAAVMVASTKPVAPRLAIVHAPVATDAVLVAAKELMLGAVIQEGDLRWQNWPQADVPPNVIRKSKMPAALAEFKGALVRNPLGAGEPIYPDRLIKAGAGFMSAILPSGMRAVAITIDQQGSTTAGGFILPNDHVDVIHTYRDEEAAKAGVADPMVSETLLRNVKVLAIGQNIQERNSERVVVGSNATLELTPQQVETIILAQRTGQLSLALRSMTDSKASEPETVAKPQPQQPPPPTAMTIVRYGVPIEMRSR